MFGGMDPATQRSFLKVFKEGPKHWGPHGTRPHHRGKLHGFGLVRRFNESYKGSWPVMPFILQLFNDVTNNEMYKYYQKEIQNGDYKALTKDDIVQGVSWQAFFGESYEAVAWPPAALDQHAPPPGLAAKLGLASCQEMCKACKVKCSSCTACPLHFDCQDRTVTILLMWQHPRTPAIHQAHWCIMGQSYPLRGGRLCIFHGAKLEHGVKAPMTPHQDYPWYGCAILCR